ncbi:MAG: sigma-70 family RNA polymerase sigma factor [Chitinophagaceae bacterium]|nr:sigma-70 family RNA polymerase sigma factor [Chitinophagaceae bacterium]MBK8607266.1 sigma-70 family RNA polymerase sigma factor [Chitinophagaceae bacterium]MBP7109438.1 sigma-70 family RNA polymerase sigma factor [Chitinophagaceae bacterium]HQZ50698.1 sigma-70 family RNA polymerase sigma factor [Chitinophagaceae bacterium]HRA11486.1 sigma-70 family RNA polymerase sigma factor [Chitinophagaceae bacterium]
MSFLKNISHNSLSDKELVALYKESGDMAILGELYQRYMELVYGVCLKYYKDPETAKDSVMQIFEELVPKLRKHEVENFKPWLHQVAKNHCLMQLRTPKNMKTVEFKYELVQSEDNVHLNGVLEKEENFKKLEFCLGTLTNEQRETVKLFYLDGKCYNEIVEITGLEWNQVRSFIQNGRRNLKLCMENEKLGVGNEL